MYYYGYFRSIDDSVDSEGQLFKVVIITNYIRTNGTELYPYEEYESSGVMIPSDGIQLTMTTDPFIVEYESDDTNIFKPYKCSTASVSFLQDRINTDFLSISNDMGTLVALLKWNNNVISNGSEYYNTKTGETLSKDTITYNSSVIYNDFTPYKVDKFCYNVEWIGFTTPETYSMTYENTSDIFTLNCQDGLSILRYYKFSDFTQNFVKSIKTLLNDFISDTGIYKNIYISDSLNIPSNLTDKPITDKIYTQVLNYRDEDSESTDKLTILSEICKTLSLTMIPYGDSIYIIDYNSVYNNEGNYHYYKLTDSDRFYNNNTVREFVYVGTKFLQHTHNINGDSFSLNGTTIGTTDIYESIKVDGDEYYYSDFIPDYEDDEEIDFTKELNLGQEYFYDNYGEQWWLLEGFAEFPKSQSSSSLIFNGELKTYYYDQDYTVGGNWVFANTPIANPIHYDGWTDFGVYNGSCILDYNIEKVEDNHVVPNTYNLKRSIYFFNECLEGYSPRYNVLNNTYNYNIENPNYRQVSLTATTKRFLANTNQYLRINGKWTFFFEDRPIDKQYYFNDSDLSKQSSWRFMWIDTKITAHIGQNTMYLNSDYEWQDAECFCKLKLKYNKTGKNNDKMPPAWNEPYDFNATCRGIDGICVKLPDFDNENISYFTIDIYRPQGVGILMAGSSFLDDFAVDILSKDYVDSFGQSNNNENNTEYTYQQYQNSNNDFYTINLISTSSYDKDTNYSHLVYKDYDSQTNYKAVDREISNKYSGFTNKPEVLILENLALQYSNKSNIVLNLNLHYNIGFMPYSLLTWNSQFDDKKFIIDKITTNYEMNRSTLCIEEKSNIFNGGDIYKKDIQKKYRRNTELNTVDRVKDNKIDFRDPSNISSGKDFGIQYNLGLAYESTEGLGMERNIRINAKFLEGDLIAYIPNSINNKFETRIENNNLIIEEL